MGLLDNLESHAEAIAAKFGIPPEKVRAIAATLHAKLSGGADPQAATMQAAEQHDVPQSRVQQILDYLLGGQIGGELGSIAKGILG